MSYLLSLPERLIRSVLGLGAGVAREAGELALPDGVRHSQLYQNLVDTTLRFLIEDVGQVEGTYPSNTGLPEDFLTRRTAGNVIEVLGVVAFRASPVWVLAALSDVCGLGRQLIPEISDALKQQGLLDQETQFTTVDQMLDGLERTSARLASTINTPPLDVPALRKEWQELRTEASHLQAPRLPSRETIAAVWTELQTEAARQNRSVFETSSMLAVSAVKVGVIRTGHFAASALLDHYRTTLGDVRQVGFTTFANRQLGPYVRAAANQFSPRRRTITERLLDKFKRKPA